MKMIKVILTMALACTCVAASAQWQWIDKEGRRVFSDRAPPPEILDKNIVKRPQVRSASPGEPEPVAVDSAQQTAATTAANGAAKDAGVDKSLEAKKKQAAEAEMAKKKAEDERIMKARIENCARAKQAKATYESGVRISRTNTAGEREVLDDAARAIELKRIQGTIDTDCR